MSDYDESEAALSNSDISHTSTDTDEACQDSGDDREESEADTDPIEDIDINDSSRELSARNEEVPVEIVTGPSWDNKKLFPPGPKCKSKAWLFGGFVKDFVGNLVTTETICGICQA